MATYDRAGAKVGAALTIVNVKSGARYSGTGNKLRSLPKGTYAVMSDIWTDRDQTDTLAARVVKVSGATKSTLDARWGKQLKISLDKAPGAAFSQELRASICAGTSGDQQVGAWNTPGKLYVVPHNSSYLRFGWSSDWTTAQDAVHSEAYAVSGVAQTVPAGMVHNYRAATLGTVTSYVRSGVSAGESVNLWLSQGRDCEANFGMPVYDGSMPAVVKLHTLPGAWSLEPNWSATQKNGESAYIGTLYYSAKVASGKSASALFLSSAWGPARELPAVGGGRIAFGTDSMFTDPGAGAGGGEGSERSLVTLYDAANKVIKQQWRTDWGADDSWFSAKVSKSGWYTLKVNGQRYRPDQKYPATLLSPRADAVFRLKADPKAAVRVADVIIPQLVPLGLSLTNSAKPGTSTTVDVRPDRRNPGNGLPFASVKGKSVTLSASADGGKTWQAMPVKKVGTKWQAVVKNPAAAGYVSLRARLLATNGQWVEVTIQRAYAVG
jgi:hypothetical protein